MNKYIYLWLEKGRKIDRSTRGKYLYSNFGVNLSSEYLCSHKWGNSSLELNIELNSRYEKNFYSDYVDDIKVFIGNNGAGKTTLLNNLYYLIAKGFGELNSDFGRYALAYVNNEGKICIKTNISRTNISLNLKNLTEGCFNYNKKHTAEFAIRYTTSFDDQERKTDDFIQHGNLNGTSDLTTNGLIFSDRETVNNHSSLVNYSSNIDALQCFYEMENNRKIDFITAFSGQESRDFWTCFKLPKNLTIAPSPINISNAISEIAQRMVDECYIGYIVSNELFYLEKKEKEKWAEYKNISDHTMQELYGDERRDELKRAIEKNYSNYYKKLGTFDKFRFAILMSYYRTYSNEQSPFFVDMSMEDFPRIDEEKNNILLNQIPLWEKGGLQNYKYQIEGIIYKISHSSKIMAGGVSLDLESDDLKVIAKINKEIFKLTPFLSFDFNRPLSSGEAALLKFFSRLYYALSNQSENLKANEIHLFLDEVDAYLHPEWQREWLSRFLEGLKYFDKILLKNGEIENHLKFQIFMATHSPFMVTDFLYDNLVLLKRKDMNDCTKVVLYNINKMKTVNTFCANIYNLLESGFFLENSIGLFAEEKICKLLEEKKNIDVKALKKNDIFESIGDPVLKSLVYENFDEDSINDKN